jgi:flagellar hook-associated protein 3 FlgL
VPEGTDAATAFDDPDVIRYIKYDEQTGKQIYQGINYVVSANQTLTVNTEADEVLNADIGRDVDEMIEAVSRAISANQKVEDIEAMQKMEAYKDDDSQAALEEWLTAAKKERDYADDNLQKLYNTYIGNFDDYLEKANLALTEVGSKGSSLALTKNRVTNQQTTVETLKSQNEDRELSDIILDYTSAYTAYEASLQAASKLNQTTLLNYL